MPRSGPARTTVQLSDEGTALGDPASTPTRVSVCCGCLWADKEHTMLSGRRRLCLLQFTFVFILCVCVFFDRQLKPDPTPLVTSRYNVFQNDEFDVFSRDSVDVSRIQKGKR